MSRTALIVEDEVAISDLEVELLKLRGYECRQAFDGRSGLESARENPPDIMILDLMLPDMDGFEVCEKLKLERSTGLVPIVMVTALDASEAQIRGLRVGANQYVTKPFSADTLLKAVDRAIEWREAIELGGCSNEVKFNFQSDISYLEQLNETLGRMFAFTDLGEEEIANLHTALMEMGTNAIEWGNKHNRELQVRLTLRMNPDRISILIEDQGEGFDPENVPHAADEEDPIAHLEIREQLGIREGGFGIMLAKGLVDEVRHNDRGNAVLMIKRLNGKAHHSGDSDELLNG